MKSRDKRRKLKKRKHEPADQIKPESRAQKGQAAGSSLSGYLHDPEGGAAHGRQGDPGATARRIRAAADYGEVEGAHG